MHEGISGYIVKRENEVKHYFSKLGYIGYSLLLFKALLILNIWDYSSFSLCFSTTKFSYTKHNLKLGKEIQKRIEVDIL